MFPIKLKFDVCNVGNHSWYCINFDVYRRYSFFTGYIKCHTLWHINSKYLKCILILLYYSNLYKITPCYFAFIRYGHHCKLYASHLWFFNWTTWNYFTNYISLNNIFLIQKVFQYCTNTWTYGEMVKYSITIVTVVSFLKCLQIQSSCNTW